MEKKLFGKIRDIGGVAGLAAGAAFLMGSSALLAGCPCANTLTVHNGTLAPITEVYVKYRLQDDWGSNRITGNILPGETENVANLPPGRHDVYLVYFGGNEEMEEVEVFCTEGVTVEADGV